MNGQERASLNSHKAILGILGNIGQFLLPSLSDQCNLEVLPLEIDF